MKKKLKKSIRTTLKNLLILKSDYDQRIRYNLVIRQIGDIKGNTFLDVGCGPGVLGKLIEKQGGKVIYLTISLSDLKNIDSSAKILGDGITLPIKYGVIDYTISTDVFEHIPIQMRARFLEEMMNVSKKGVIFTFSRLHHANPQQSGITLFENNFKKFKIPVPDWYDEHNRNSIPELEDIILIYPQININKDISAYQGRLNIIFLIFSLDLNYFLKILTKEKIPSLIWILERLFNIIFYYIIRVIDTPPFYSYTVKINK